MKLLKNILVITLLAFGLSFVVKPAQAADYSVTFGAPFLVGG
ncbi:MAG TPA: hypothetical protein VHR47_01400 [Bacillota bacterium]|nr:hypothetical protein [Bacillota bacterium]